MSFTPTLLCKAITHHLVALYLSSLCFNTFSFIQLKALGEQEKAMEKYVAALHVYVDIAGQNNTSYASALANIGKQLPNSVIFNNVAGVLILCFEEYSVLWINLCSIFQYMF